MIQCPKISIVTPTFNQGKYIEQTIQSVLNQNYPNLEYIIIDGGSTDNTVEVIRKYEQHLKFWVSEKDKGQSNAINKGLQHCNGDIFNWLNSDDYLELGALSTIAEIFVSGATMVAGKVRIFKDSIYDENTVELVQHSNLSSKGLMYWQKGVQFVQPGVWMKRDIFFKCGGIEENLHYSFDWDLYIRYLSLFPKVNYTDRLLIHFRYHEQSKTVSMQEKFKQEEGIIIQKLTLQNGDKSLQKVATLKWAEKKWLSFLKEIINQTNKSKVSKVFNFLRGVNGSNIKWWRATAGAIKNICLVAK